jgi:hypothetical protein
MKIYLRPSLDGRIPLLREQGALESLLLIHMQLWKVNLYCVSFKFHMPDMEIWCPRQSFFPSVS